MKALSRYQYGDRNQLRLAEIERPVPAPQEVQVKVAYTTVNRTDCGLLSGKPLLVRAFIGWPRPRRAILGTDFSGRVSAVGSAVKGFQVGDRVWGLHDEGLSSQAEYLCIAEKGNILPLPPDLPEGEAVAMAEGGHYAYNFLNKVKLAKGQKVLIYGATGAIGTMTLQFLKARGLTVWAVGPQEQLALLESLGADHTLDYRTEDYAQVQQTFDFVFDAVGKSCFAQAKKVLRPQGVYISSELGPGSENLYLPLLTRLWPGPKVSFPFPSNCKRSLRYLLELHQKSAVQAVIDRILPPADYLEAYAYVASGQKTGAVLLKW